jgi:hypothetical protein
MLDLTSMVGIDRQSIAGIRSRIDGYQWPILAGVFGDTWRFLDTSSPLVVVRNKKGRSMTRRSRKHVEITRKEDSLR